MIVVTDEDLMAFADGVLGEAAAAEIAALAAKDPVVAAKIEAFRQSRATLAGAFDAVLTEAVPDRFLASIDHYLPAQATAEVISLDARRKPKAAARFAWPDWRQAAAAAMIAVTAGGVGYWAKPSGDGAAIGLGAASPVLARALDAGQSGQRFAMSSEAGLIPVTSFIDKEARACREFETQGGSSAGAGIACRTTDGWRIEAWVAQPTGTTSGGKDFVTVGVGDNPVLNAALAQLGESHLLDGAQEACAIANNWRGDLAACVRAK